MKPTIPETATVISLDNGTATVLLRGSGHCKGCGAGKIGLCKPGGKSMILRVENNAGAVVGDIVAIGVDSGVRVRGYFLAYIMPIISFITGALIGHIAGEYFNIDSLDVSAGFLFLTFTSFFTFSKLRRLDRTSMLIIKRIISERVFELDIKSDEERRFEEYLGAR